MARPAVLSRTRVLDATLALAAEQGLDAVSMRSVADRLGVSPMALYRHVGDKQGLLDGLVERLLAELPTPDPALAPLERLAALARGLRDLARRHPDAFPMLLRRPATTPESLTRRELIYAALADAGVDDALIPRVERLLSTLLIGWAASEAGGRFAAHDRATLDADLEWFGEVLAAALPSG